MEYEYKQIISGLVGFVATLELRMKDYIPNLPVYFLENGDYMYVQEQKFIKHANEVTLTNPRMCLSMEDLQPNDDQNSNPFNKMLFKSETTSYQATARRTNITIPISVSLVAKGFILGLQQYEMMLAHMSNENVFTYEYQGNTFDGMYSRSSISMQKATLEPSQSQQNFVTKTTIDLLLPIYLPRINTIKPIDEVGYDGTIINIVTKGETKSEDITSILKP